MKCIVDIVKIMLAVSSLEISCSKGKSVVQALILYGGAQMSKLVSVGLIAAAMFATPAMAAWYDKNGSVIHPSRVVHCIRAPDVGQFAGGPYNNPPCEPATWR